MDNFIIKPMQTEEIEDVAVVLTDAFFSNPAYTAIFKEKNG